MYGGPKCNYTLGSSHTGEWFSPKYCATYDQMTSQLFFHIAHHHVVSLDLTENRVPSPPLASPVLFWDFLVHSEPLNPSKDVASSPGSLWLVAHHPPPPLPPQLPPAQTLLHLLPTPRHQRPRFLPPPPPPRRLPVDRPSS